MQDIATLQQKVRDAEAALQAAKDAAEEARRSEQDARHSAALQAVLAADEADFNTDDPRQTPVRPYILPFGREYGRWNPYDVDNAAFGKDWLSNSTALICLRTDEPRTRPSRLIFTSGMPIGGDDGIGSEFTARHDQTGARLGEYKIVGLVYYDLEGNVARVVGNVPPAKLSQNTYK